MTQDEFTTKVLRRCARGVWTHSILDVLGALEEASGKTHLLDMDTDTFAEAINLRASDLSTAQLDEVAKTLRLT